MIVLAIMTILAVVIYSIVKHNKISKGREMHFWIVDKMHQGTDNSELVHLICQRYGMDPLMAGVAIGMAAEGDTEWFEDWCKQRNN